MKVFFTYFKWNIIKSMFFYRNLVKDVIRRTLLEIAENGIPSTLQQAVEMLTKSLTSYASIKIRNVQLKTYDYYKSIDSNFR